jgi:hypothetical protein
MIKKIKVPGHGEVEIDLVMHPSVKEGTLYVQKVGPKFYIVKYREFHEPTDMMIHAAVKGHAREERQDLERAHDLDLKRKMVRASNGETLAS